MIGPGVAAAEQVEEYALPGLGLTLNEAAGGRLVVGLGLQGVAWLEPGSEPGATARLMVEPSILTLGTLEVENGAVLLAGRDVTLRLVRFETEGDCRMVTLWESPAEGIPTGLARRGDLLAVAGGGAGVSLWHWPDTEQPPALVGRFPFASYTKQAAFFDDTTLLVADSHTAGLWVLDVSDPRRPHRREHLKGMSFVDATAVRDELAAYTDRAFGTWFVRRSADATKPFELAHRVFMVPAPSDGDFVQNVRFQNGDAVIVESFGGVRRFTRTDSGDWRQRDRHAAQEGVVDALFTREGRIAYTTRDKRLKVMTPSAAK
ncbi:MAG: hypothetical protein KF858_09320 [Candidatus Sumerlaeia bacterium]|nr:hypothetical protein [Candidatus Sumerlaeia bacterium]